MRRFALLLLFLNLARPLSAATQVSVSQLEEFLLSRRASKETDAELAHQLSSIQLSEHLTDSRLAGICAKLRVGPKTAEQLDLLAISSVFEVPPSAELPSVSPPDSLRQQQIMESARAYTAATIHDLPDFIALRLTRAFDNAPQFTGKRHSKPEIGLHFVREHRREVTFRAGQEILASRGTGSGGEESRTIDSEGLSTWGEFGPILTTILGDSLKGRVVWNRWQNSASGKVLAVFRYSVPKPASHDWIDLCCYLTSLENPQFLSFRDKPAYHGDLYIDPASGAIFGITLEAELSEDAPLRVSKISVQYDKVEIGGKNYVCPVRGVALSIVHDLQMERLDGVGLERFVNVVRFTDYHKFGSTARILNSY